jgi:DNA topoisomerase IA
MSGRKTFRKFYAERLDEKFGRLDKKDANYFGWVVQYEIRSKGYTRAFDLDDIHIGQERKAEKELPRLLKIIAKENRVKVKDIENAKIKKQPPAGYSND